MMKYVSTRGEKKELTGAQAIIQGMAPDKGLYVPKYIPQLPFEISDMKFKGYKEVAKKIIGTFFDDYTADEIEFCVESAYDEKFDTEDIVPVKEAGGAYFLELYHGKTAAFKDMALSILPYLLTTAMKKENEDKKVCILTATSGDTGKAALEGFADVDGTEIVVFYPNSGVSKVQERQMITQQGKNTHVFAVKGNFDDAQTGVKKIFNDRAMADELAKDGFRLSSANSINIGRLIPQVAYYVYGYVKLLEKNRIVEGDRINVVVPTGNFGNILAAFYAKKMGLPIDKLICASNRNKVLTDFFLSGEYDVHRDFYLTNSPSMDILISSNLERLLYHVHECDSQVVKSLMASLDSVGRYRINDTVREALADFRVGFADIGQTNETIGKMYAKNSYLIDTHTAVAYKVHEDYIKTSGDDKPTLIASTASPYKFAESVAESIGLGKEDDDFKYIVAINKATQVPVPAGLKDLTEKKILHKGLIEIAEMKETVGGSVRMS